MLVGLAKAQLAPILKDTLSTPVPRQNRFAIIFLEIGLCRTRAMTSGDLVIRLD
jgi:hypothetical protein